MKTDGKKSFLTKEPQVGALAFTHAFWSNYPNVWYR